MEVLFGFYLAFFVLGTIIGSFLNVLIDRIPRNESVIKTRSHCEHCRRTLQWNDLIPVISFLVLDGKCRYCRKEFSLYYPVVELLTGLLFVLTAAYLVSTIGLSQFFDIRFIPSVVYNFFMISCLIVITFTDLKYGIIPFKIAFAALTAAFLTAIVSPFFLNYLLTALSVFGFFLLLFFITRGKGLGFGDVVYAFLLGLILGFPKIIVGLYVAFLTGAIVSLILVWSGKKKMKGDSIPFGPFLVTGTILGMFYGNFLIDWAMRLLVY